MRRCQVSAGSGNDGARLECRQRQAGGVTILDLSGRLVENETADEFHALFRRLVRTGKTRLVLNLRHLGSLDVPSLCALLVDPVRIRQVGGDLELVYVQPPNMDLLRRTGTYDAFRIFTTEQDAVNGFSSAA